MKFSQRIGKEEIKVELEKEGISNELRNSLWTLILELVINTRSNQKRYQEYSELSIYFRDLWIYFFKFPIDTLPWCYEVVTEHKAIPIVRKWFFESDWYLVYNFIEFSSSYNSEFQKTCNEFLKKEMSAYRFIDGKLIEINSKDEIIEIENAIINADKFKSIKEHLKSAIALLSDKQNPNYRNSIKESISAVESLSKIITNTNKSTLGHALKQIEKKQLIPNNLKTAFSALYGYTSDEGGIRHSLLENSVNVNIEEARFMLVTCSAFINYLLCKL